MTTRNLDAIFNPRSIALFGASDRPGSVGATVAGNLLTGGFAGDITLVNPRRPLVEGRQALADLDEMAEAPDLAVIATPPSVIPALLDRLGARGTRGAVVLTAPTSGTGSLAAEIGDVARRRRMRLVGPNSIGVLCPAIGLNASFAHRHPAAGRLALVTQSGAILTALLDWAASKRLGFSHLVSVGNMSDVDVDDLVDWFAGDPHCRAILLYLEGITDAGGFLSAARSAARAKPLVAIKAGRRGAGAAAARTHSGAMAGSDEVYDAVFERAGVLRVDDLDDLFGAAETLTHLQPLDGARLAVVTNGGGLGILAADALDVAGGRLAELAPATVSALDAALPPTWSRGNPVDVIGDAGADRYRVAVQSVLDDAAVDCVLAIYTPTSTSVPEETARAVIDVVEAQRRRCSDGKPVIASWVGAEWVAAARRAFAEAAVPSYETPAAAVHGFMQLVRYSRVRQGLLHIPPRQPTEFERDRETARAVIDAGLRSEGGFVTWPNARRVLAAYDIPVVEAELARTPEQAAAIAEAIVRRGGSCAMKIVSAQVVHKSDVGGVRLGIASAEEAREAAVSMRETVLRAMPGATIDGFMVERMVERRRGVELIAGLATDPVFGPIVLFGRGGTAVEVIGDRALALPPLDRVLALQLMERTRVIRRLRGYRDVPPADLDAIAATLVKLSQLVVDFPEIRELDINPLVADSGGVVAVDARITVRSLSEAERAAGTTLAIRPYPEELASRTTTRGGIAVLIRPVKPVDAWLYEDFFRRLDPNDVRLRFFSHRKELTPEFVARLTQVDYARAIAFVAFTPDEEHILGVSRLVRDPDGEGAEFAVIVRSDLKARGLGVVLMQTLLDYARSQRVATVYGHILAENSSMLRMASELGFRLATEADDPSVVMARLDIDGAAADA